MSWNSAQQTNRAEDWVTRVSAKGHYSPDLPFATRAEWWLGEEKGNARKVAQ